MARPSSSKPTKLDDTQLRSWTKNPPDHRIEVADALLPAFYAVRQPTGKISFVVRYQFDRVPRKFTLGQFPKLTLAEARQRAKDAFADVANGIDPAVEKRIKKSSREPGFNLIENVIARWASAAPLRHPTRKAIAQKTIDNYLGVLNQHFCRLDWAEGSKRKAGRGQYRGRTIQSITLANLIDCRDDAFETSPSQARSFVKALRVVFKFAVAERLLEKQTNPAQWCEMGAMDAKRARVLKPSELSLVLEAAKVLAPKWQALTELILLTGKRRSEVQQTRRSEWSFRTGVWIIPPARVKTRVADQIPILQRMRDIIASVPRIGEPGPDDLLLGGAAHVNAKRRLDREIVRLLAARQGVAVTKATTLASLGFEPWVWHDLRRSANTCWKIIGIPYEVREQMLNHSKGVLGETYDPGQHVGLKRAALDKWASHLELIRAGLVPDEDAVYEDLDWASDVDEDASEMA